MINYLCLQTHIHHGRHLFAEEELQGLVPCVTVYTGVCGKRSENIFSLSCYQLKTTTPSNMLNQYEKLEKGKYYNDTSCIKQGIGAPVHFLKCVSFKKHLLYRESKNYSKATQARQQSDIFFCCFLLHHEACGDFNSPTRDRIQALAVKVPSRIHLNAREFPRVTSFKC